MNTDWFASVAKGGKGDVFQLAGVVLGSLQPTRASLVASPIAFIEVEVIQFVGQFLP